MAIVTYVVSYSYTYNIIAPSYIIIILCSGYYTKLLISWVHSRQLNNLLLTSLTAAYLLCTQALHVSHCI